VPLGLPRGSLAGALGSFRGAMSALFGFRGCFAGDLLRVAFGALGDSSDRFFSPLGGSVGLVPNLTLEVEATRRREGAEGTLDLLANPLEQPRHEVVRGVIVVPDKKPQSSVGLDAKRCFSAAPPTSDDPSVQALVEDRAVDLDAPAVASS